MKQDKQNMDNISDIVADALASVAPGDVPPVSKKKTASIMDLVSDVMSVTQAVISKDWSAKPSASTLGFAIGGAIGMIVVSWGLMNANS